jgi:hypothetical protein
MVAERDRTSLRRGLGLMSQDRTLSALSLPSRSPRQSSDSRPPPYPRSERASPPPSPPSFQHFCTIQAPHASLLKTVRKHHPVSPLQGIIIGNMPLYISGVPFPRPEFDNPRTWMHALKLASYHPPTHPRCTPRQTQDQQQHHCQIAMRIQSSVRATILHTGTSLIPSRTCPDTENHGLASQASSALALPS